ncbi:MAG: pyridoxamine 5'-phosphate oxidase family protein [Phycisphaerales bacterium]
MGSRYPEIPDRLKDFIAAQRMFFVGTAAPDGRVNVSPKGMDSLRVLGPNRVIWLNVTGSGNETAAHLLENERMTLMWCAFEGQPMILRLYGKARAVHPGEADWDELFGHMEPIPGARQMLDMHVDLVQTSCGTGVPLYDYVDDRPQLRRWAERKGTDGVEQYWQDKNRLSIDGRPTGIPGDA